MAAWMIRFDFPEGTMYAGWTKDALGYAYLPTSAAEFPTEQIAASTLANSYGEEIRSYGKVVRAA